MSHKHARVQGGARTLTGSHPGPSAGTDPSPSRPPQAARSRGSHSALIHARQYRAAVHHQQPASAKQQTARLLAAIPAARIQAQQNGTPQRHTRHCRSNTAPRTAHPPAHRSDRGRGHSGRWGHYQDGQLPLDFDQGGPASRTHITWQVSAKLARHNRLALALSCVPAVASLRHPHPQEDPI